MNFLNQKIIKRNSIRTNYSMPQRNHDIFIYFHCDFNYTFVILLFCLARIKIQNNNHNVCQLPFLLRHFYFTEDPTTTGETTTPTEPTQGEAGPGPGSERYAK